MTNPRLRRRPEAESSPRIPAALIKFVVFILATGSVAVNVHLFRLSANHQQPTAASTFTSAADSSVVTTPPSERIPAVHHSNAKLKSAIIPHSPPESSPQQQVQLLPRWMRDYFRWHHQQRAGLTADNWQEHKYLVVRCLNGDVKCGGTADRLRPLPFHLLVAAQLNRILLYHWERPCALQEFLVPPDHSANDDIHSSSSMDWRWPEFIPANTFTLDPELEVLHDILPHLDPDGIWTQSFRRKRQRKRAAKSLPAVASMLYQSAGHGANIYNAFTEYQANVTAGTPAQQQDPDYNAVFSPCWKAVFQPSPAVAALIQQEQTSLGLVPDQYVGVHIRSQYHNHNGDIALRTVVRNAINCATELQLAAAEPIFVATDAARAVQAVQAYGKRHDATLVQRSSASGGDAAAAEPLHLDRGSAFLAKNTSLWTTSAEPADYYDTFVDLYLLAASRCMTYHVGGYGKWANLISSNPACERNHLKNQCRWTEHA